MRDGQILQIAQSVDASAIDIFDPDIIPLDGSPFTIDARLANPSESIASCPGDICPPLQTDGTLYGYDPTWAATNFTRVVRASCCTCG